MYRKLATNIYLVHNGKELNDLWDERNKPEIEPDPNRIKDPVELLYPYRTELMVDYPIIVAFETREDRFLNDYSFVTVAAINAAVENKSE